MAGVAPETSFPENLPRAPMTKGMDTKCSPKVTVLPYGEGASGTCPETNKKGEPSNVMTGGKLAADD